MRRERRDAGAVELLAAIPLALIDRYADPVPALARLTSGRGARGELRLALESLRDRAEPVLVDQGTSARQEAEAEEFETHSATHGIAS
jgi:hypothetical protein